VDLPAELTRQLVLLLADCLGKQGIMQYLSCWRRSADMACGMDFMDFWGRDKPYFF
jgi:hypothetical protein